MTGKLMLFSLTETGGRMNGKLVKVALVGLGTGFSIGFAVGLYLYKQHELWKQSQEIGELIESEYAGVRYNEDGTVARMIGFGA